MYLLSRWDNLCSDSFWVHSLLAWFAMSKDPRLQREATLQCLRKAAMCEVLLLNETKDAIVSCENGDVIATVSPVISSISTSLQAFASTEHLKLRPSDMSLIDDCPLAFCFLMMDNAYHPDRPPAKTVTVRILQDLKQHLKVDEVVTVRATERLGNFIGLVLKSALQATVAICQIEVYGDRPVEARYDMARKVPASPYQQKLSIQTKDEYNLDVVTTLPVTWYECSTESAYSEGLLHFADVGSAVVWDHVLPLTCPFYTQFAKEDGRRQFIVMYRGVACHIFAWPRKGSAIECLSWISKTGNSTFDMRCDFRDGPSKAPLATLQFTMVMVDRIKMKASPVFHSKEWAEKRYEHAIRGGLPADLSPPGVFKIGLPASSARFRYSLELRHSDQDMNGHVNSGKYLDLVHDCRVAALKAGFFSSNVHKLVAREGWIRRFGLDYQAELHITDDGSPHIQMSLTEQDKRTVVLVFEFMSHGKICTRVWVETSENHDTYATRDESEGDYHGLTPVHWGLPDADLKANIDLARLKLKSASL